MSAIEAVSVKLRNISSPPPSKVGRKTIRPSSEVVVSAMTMLPGLGLDMRRREFLGVIGCAAAACGCAQSSNVHDHAAAWSSTAPRVGFQILLGSAGMRLLGGVRTFGRIGPRAEIPAGCAPGVAVILD